MSNQFDHPLIAFFQAVAAVGIVRLFFAVRLTPFPLPQLVLALAVSMLVNLTARVTNAPWFYVANITMFALLGAALEVSRRSTIHRQRAEAEAIAKQIASGEAVTRQVRVPDFFDNWQVQIQWAVALIAGCLLLYGYVNNYEAKQLAIQQTKIEATKREERAERERIAQEKANQELLRAFQDTLLTQVGSLTDSNKKSLANQKTQMANQSKIMQSVFGVKPAVRRAAQPSKAKAKAANGNGSFKLKNMAPVQPISPKQIPEPEPQQQKKGFWKKWFGRADTTRNHPGTYTPGEMSVSTNQ